MAARKLDALYVDFGDGLIATPAQVAPMEAVDLLRQVEDAIAHATEHLGALSSEVAQVIEEIAPQIVEPMSLYVDSLSPPRGRWSSAPHGLNRADLD